VGKTIGLLKLLMRSGMRAASASLVGGVSPPRDRPRRVRGSRHRVTSSPARSR
jgi:hypothetical protein